MSVFKTVIESGHRQVMVIGSINVNSLLLHISEVRELIKDKGFHILAVNETKLDSTIADSLLGVDGYAMHKQDRDRHGGGVAVYVRDSLKHHRRRDIPEEGLEFISIEVKPTNALPFLVAAWYRTPSDPIESFTKLEGIFEFFDHENKETILLGDTNCDMYWRTPLKIQQIMFTLLCIWPRFMTHLALRN